MIVIMGSGAETVHETVEHLVARGEKVGRAQGPALPSVRARGVPGRAAADASRHLAVLDRTKEPGAPGDPLYLDVVTALAEAQAEDVCRSRMPRVVAGRYGLSSKEFTPAMVKAVFDELDKPKPKRHFTIGIVDDVTHTSLPWDASFETEGDDVSASLFYGLGADGTVGANKNSIKIIGAGDGPATCRATSSTTRRSPARSPSRTCASSPRPIRSAYLVDRAGFVACHQFEFVDKIDVLEHAAPGAAFLLNAPFAADAGVGPPAAGDAGADHREDDPLLRDRRLRAARKRRHGRAHQHDHADLLLRHLRRPAARGGDRAHQEGDREDLRQARPGGRAPQLRGRRPGARRICTRSPCRRRRAPRAARPPLVSEQAPDFVQKVTAVMLAGKGDLLPVSAFPVDGTWPTGDREVGEAEPRARDPGLGLRRSASSATSARSCARTPPSGPRSTTRALWPARRRPSSRRAYRGNEYKGKQFTIQVAPEDCTGCNLCVNVCPAKDRTNPKHKAIDMQPQAPLRERRARQLRLLPRPAGAGSHRAWRSIDHKSSQFLRAAVRVLGRLRRLRRDAVPQAADAALRRPAAHRQRHRLLVDLRRQPADDAVHDQPRRPRAGLVELAVRGQRGVRLRLPPGARRARRGARAACVERLAAQLGDDLVDGAARRRPVDRGGHRRAARARSVALRDEARRRWTPPRRGGSRRSPTTS